MTGLNLQMLSMKCICSMFVAVCSNTAQGSQGSLLKQTEKKWLPLEEHFAVI